MPKIFGDPTPFHELKEPEYVVTKLSPDLGRGFVDRKFVNKPHGVGVRLVSKTGLETTITLEVNSDGVVSVRAMHGLIVVKPRAGNVVEVEVE
jgi:hypothetical protein